MGMWCVIYCKSFLLSQQCWMTAVCGSRSEVNPGHRIPLSFLKHPNFNVLFPLTVNPFLACLLLELNMAVFCIALLSRLRDCRTNNGKIYKLQPAKRLVILVMCKPFLQKSIVWWITVLWIYQLCGIDWKNENMCGSEKAERHIYLRV